MRGNVANPLHVDALSEQVRARHGRVDIVFANAGFAAPAPLARLSEEHVDGLLNTNIKGVVWTVRQALPLMSAGSEIFVDGGTAQV